MSNRNLTILGIVAVVMVLLAVVQSQISSKLATGQNIPTYLIQGLGTADVGSIVIGKGDDAVTLKRQDGHFVVVNKDDYPADVGKINELITSCLDIQTVELCTEKAENHKDLGVTEQDAQDVVKFLKRDSSPLVDVLVGKAGPTGQGGYARLTSSDKVYLISQRPWIRDKAIDYINQELISLHTEDIEEVTVSGPNETYTLKRNEADESIVLENMPEGKKFKGTEYNKAFTALSNLHFLDVRKVSSDKERLIFDRQYTCRLKNSTVYLIQLAKEDEKAYIMCEAEFGDTAAVVKDQGVESEEELKKKEAKLLAHDEAQEFTIKHQGWVYEISKYKAENLTKGISELLEDIPGPKGQEVVDDANAVEDEQQSDRKELEVLIDP